MTTKPLPPVAIVVRATHASLDQVEQARAGVSPPVTLSPGCKVLASDTTAELQAAINGAVRRPLTFFSY